MASGLVEKYQTMPTRSSSRAGGWTDVQVDSEIYTALGRQWDLDSGDPSLKHLLRYVLQWDIISKTIVPWHLRTVCGLVAHDTLVGGCWETGEFLEGQHKRVLATRPVLGPQMLCPCVLHRQSNPYTSRPMRDASNRTEDTQSWVSEPRHLLVACYAGVANCFFC